MKNTITKTLSGYLFILVLSFAAIIGCKQKMLSGKDLEDKLKETMVDYLHKTMKEGTTVDIRELTYFADKERKIYICDFSVNVHTPTSDTTGIMKANISQDFKTVTRLQ